MNTHTANEQKNLVLIKEVTEVQKKDGMVNGWISVLGHVLFISFAFDGMVSCSGYLTIVYHFVICWALKAKINEYLNKQQAFRSTVE